MTDTDCPLCGGIVRGDRGPLTSVDALDKFGPVTFGPGCGPFDHPIGCQCPYPAAAAERDRLVTLTREPGLDGLLRELGAWFGPEPDPDIHPTEQGLWDAYQTALALTREPGLDVEAGLADIAAGRVVTLTREPQPMHIWRTKTGIRDGSPTGRFVVDWTEAEDALDEASRAPLDVARLARAIPVAWNKARLYRPAATMAESLAAYIAREYAALASEDRP